jgi:hypothetical protein
MVAAPKLCHRSFDAKASTIAIRERFRKVCPISPTVARAAAWPLMRRGVMLLRPRRDPREDLRTMRR